MDRPARRLKLRLAGCTDWRASGPRHMQPLMAGQANVDDNPIELPPTPPRGVAALLRPHTWLWPSGGSTHAGQQIDAGARALRGRGRPLLCRRYLDGRAICVRFVWSGITPNAACWEQAFSADGGITWEPNWVMDFERAAAQRSGRPEERSA
jgi:hypothetical protein